MENIEPRREIFKIFISNFTVFYIQFRDSFDKEKQVKWLKSVARFVYKIYIYFLIDVVLGVWVIVKYFWTQFNSLNSPCHGINDSSPSIYRPSPEEAKKWATSFESVLKHKFGVQLFQDFLRSQYGEENLNFWLAVEEYKKADDNIRAEKARVIYEDYVSTLSPTEVSWIF